MYALLAIAALAALAFGSAAKKAGEPAPTTVPLDKDELTSLYQKNPQLYTLMNTALASAGVNPADLYPMVVWLASNGFPKTATMVMSQYNARTKKVTGASGKQWRLWTNTTPSATLSAENVAQGWTETHVMMGDGGMFESQKILVFGQKGNDQNTRALGGVWSPIPDGVPAGTVEAAKRDFLPASLKG